MRQKKYYFIVILVLILHVTSIELAQSDSDYEISGFVTTKDSLPIRRIKVELMDGDQVLDNDETDLFGYYRIDTELDENREYTLYLFENHIQDKYVTFETHETEISVDVVVNRVPTANIECAEKGYPNDQFFFSSFGSNDLDGDPLSFSWDFGDGAVSEESDPTHVYMRLGKYTVSLQVEDVDGATDDKIVEVEILNRPPVAVHNGPYHTRVGSVVKFSSEGSIDPDGDPLEIEWDFGDGIKAHEANPEVVYDEIGEFKVKLRVFDVHGEKDEVETKCYVVENLAPIGEANGPYLGYDEIPLKLSSEGSTDPDGEIQSYYWEFEDGQTSAEESPIVTFQETGVYSAQLTVTDHEGESNTDTTTIEIVEMENLAPIVQANGPYSGKINEYIQFSSSGTSDPNGDPLEYLWEFGNDETSLEPNPKHEYIEAGTYTISLIVTDPEQATSTATTTCTIRKPNSPVSLPPSNKKPKAKAIIPREGETEKAINFSAAGSKDPDGIISEFFWDFGDGANSNHENPTHIYTMAGNYSVTLVVADSQGKSDDVTSSISIIDPNIPPVVTLNESFTAKTGDTIQFTLLECYDPDGEVTQYHWIFGDNVTISSESADYNYYTPGKYNVTLTVTDDRGKTATATSIANIIENIPPRGVITSRNITKVGEVVEFSALNSIDEDGQVTYYMWDFGDGAFSYEPIMNHTYLKEGEINVRLVVTDENNAQTEVDSMINVVKNISPTIDVNNSMRGRVHEELSFVSYSFDPDGEIISILWEFGDEASAIGETVNHEYISPGVYNAKITVTDNNHETSVENIEIHIDDEPAETIFPFLTLSASSVMILGYIFRKPWLKLINKL